MSVWIVLSEHLAMTCRALNLQDRTEAASKQKMSDEEKQKYRAAGPSMSIAQRHDELERQHFATEPPLKSVVTCDLLSSCPLCWPGVHHVYPEMPSA